MDRVPEWRKETGCTSQVGQSHVVTFEDPELEIAVYTLLSKNGKETWYMDCATLGIEDVLIDEKVHSVKEAKLFGPMLLRQILWTYFKLIDDLCHREAERILT